MRKHPFVTTLLVIAIGLGVWVIFAWRTHTTTLTAQKLCIAIAVLIKSGDVTPKPGDPGYAYYHNHPKEAARLHAKTNASLDLLPCKVSNGR